MDHRPQLSRSITGRVAIVTGAASGMGLATAGLLAAEGARVAMIDRSADTLVGHAAAIAADGGDVRAYPADLSDPAAIDRVAAAVRADLGPVDILVNNAGVSLPAPIGSPDFEDMWARTFAVNVDAQMRLIRACLDDLVRDGEGRIVNIASTEGLGGSAAISPYTASKHAVVGLTRSLAIELGPAGVTVNAVCPGPIHTGMTADIADEHKATFARRRTALRRYGRPEEVAHITLSLVLPAASYITGAIIPVDGGMTARNN